MNRPSRLIFTAAALVLAAAPLLAEEPPNDDLLRPMIVRPVDGSSASASTSASPSPSHVPAPVETTAPPPSASETMLVNQTTYTQTAAAEPPKLKLPPPPSASSGLSVPPTRTVALSPGGRNLFADFGPPSGSVVSDRVFQLRDETIALRRNIDKDAAEFNELRDKGAAGAIQYHATVAAINARLESGTTRGNPILLRQWSEAEQSLSEGDYSISRLNVIATNLAANSATAAYLLQAARATFELAGAVDEDHSQLAMIRDEVARATVSIDGMRGEVHEDIKRQTTYQARERQNLQVLALAINRGELIRNSLAGQAVVVANPSSLGSLPGSSLDYSGYPSLNGDAVMIPVTPAAIPAVPVKKTPLSKRRKPSPAPAAALAPPRPRAKAAVPAADPLGQLLVLVRFNQEDVAYEQQLYQAVSDALEVKPGAAFTVVAVTPKSEDPAAIGSDTEAAQRHADEVKNSLVQLGLQPGSISMSGISSGSARSPEVHIYVR